MPVPEEKITTSYISNGEKEFVIPFKFLTPESIKVFFGDDLQEKVQGKDFSIIDNYVVFKDNVPQNIIVTIKRATNITQTEKFLNNTKLPADVLNFSFDKIIMICQELAEKLTHALMTDNTNVTLEDIIKDIESVRDFAASGNALSDAATKAAVSAAQSLISAIEARQYRDKALEYSDKAVAASDITAHNEYDKSHPYLLDLIAGLQTIFEQHAQNYEQHIEDYEQHKTDNSNDHKKYDEFTVKTENRLELLENTANLNKGNMYYAFGYNNKCQLGVNWTANITSEPIEHFAMRNVKKVSTSLVCGTAIAGGRIYVTGNGASGLCGPDRQACYGFKPHPAVDNIYNFVDTVCFNETAFALDNNGNLYSWGDGALHCLGDGSTVDRAIPRHIMPSVKFKKIAAGCRVMLALTEDGYVYSCGSSAYGALGHAVASQTAAQLKLISNFDNIVDIAAGGFVADGKYLNFCAAIQQNEGEAATLFTWGYNGYGQLGLGTTVSHSAPQLINIDFEPAQIACGAGHLAVLSKDGSVYITGAKAALQSSANTTTLKLIESDDIFIDIATCRDVTYMLSTSKYLYGVGAANYGSMLTEASTATPVKLLNNKIDAIFAGPQNYGCAFTMTEAEDEEL